MNRNQMIAKMIADTDQDIEAGKEWIKRTSEKELIKLWLMMNEEYPNPYTEIMTRFAIIGFCMLVKSLEDAGSGGSHD